MQATFLSLMLLAVQLQPTPPTAPQTQTPTPVEYRPGDAYAGFVNNADLYIDYCTPGIPGRRQCVERHAQAWGQVCTQEQADWAASGGHVEGGVPDGYVYTAWHCIMEHPTDKLLDGGTSGVPIRPVS